MLVYWCPVGGESPRGRTWPSFFMRS